MATWIVFLIVALLFFIAEIATPTMFFLNFSISAVICSIIGIFTDNYDILIPIFVILAILLILFLRPMLNLNPTEVANEYFDSQYVGKKGKAISNINFFSGRLTIFDENWEARTLSEDAPEIKKGDIVTVKKHDDLTMYVEKKGKKQ